MNLICSFHFLSFCVIANHELVRIIEPLPQLFFVCFKPKFATSCEAGISDGIHIHPLVGYPTCAAGRRAGRKLFDCLM